MTDETLYRKVGRRYEPARTTNRHWFPADGVWLVRDAGKSARQIVDWTGDVPDPIRLASFARHHDLVCRVLEARGGCSRADLADAILNALEAATRP